MSTNSLSAEDEEALREGAAHLNADELEQVFETRDTPFFHVEFTEKDKDIVYHFWPPGDHEKFCPNFQSLIEKAFEEVLPSDQEVHASWTSLVEAQVQLAHGTGAVPRKDAFKNIVYPRETYYVRVVDGLTNPLSDIFLKGRVFDTLVTLLKESS